MYVRRSYQGPCVIRMKLRYIHVNLTHEKHESREYEGFLGPIDLGIHLHLNVYESYKHDIFSEDNVVIMGKGFFANEAIFGSHRLVFIFRSPLSKGLHVSALGGGAYRFVKTGLDGIVFEGRAAEPAIVLVEGLRDEVRVRFDYVGKEDLLKVYKGYEGRRGVRALTRYLIRKYSDFLKQYEGRMVLIGPASYTTRMGGICSPSIDYVTMDVRVEDWAARGGGGSVLARAHNILAVIFGGNKVLNDLRGRFEFINSLVTTQLKKPFVKSVIEGTSKYSYDLETKTGGTFGSNITIYRDKIPTHNWSSILASREKRELIHRIMVEKYLKPFNEKIISTGIWRTCDEPCPIRCKKTIDSKHVDYEPLNAVGPMIGIIDFHEALEILDLVDELGLDAIEAGNILGWLMEVLEKELLKPEELGLDAVPVINPDKWSEEHAKRNKRIAMKLIEDLVFTNNELLKLVAEEGLRKACKKLDELFYERVHEKGTKFEDLAVYVPFGSDGYITPNFYWSPGVFAPLPILGKYWTYYTPAFSEPEEFADISVNRALMEYLIENAGWCRFHRSWVEKILQELYKIFLGYDGDLLNHAREYYKMLREYQIKARAENVFWESKKVLSILRNAACEFGPSEWCSKINSDPSMGLREWWIRFYEHMIKLLEGGNSVRS